MADIIYTVNQDNPDFIPGFEQYLQTDKDLVSTFEINNLFDSTKNFVELHILSLADDILESHYDYSNFKLLGTAQSAGKQGASTLTIDAVEDTKAYGYYNGGIKLLYHFLNDLYTQDTTSAEFFIESISDDRTELRLQTLTLSTEEVLSYTNRVKDALNNTSYFTEFRLNFKNNNLLIGTNIDTVDYLEGKAVVIKLYEPLPSTFNEKSTLNIVEVVADSVVYEVDSEFIVEPITYPTLKDPNFNLDISEESIVPTSYYDYNELFSYPISNANSEIYSLVNEKGAGISIDHTDYKNFIHFSSAQERLINFKYKLDLITSYSGSLSSASNATTGLQGISGSTSYYEGLISGVVNNFDHYERFLYYESGSSSWPKSTTTRPYNNIPSSVTQAQNWYNSQLTEALAYDRVNDSSLIYSIPTYLRDDPDNDRYLTYIYMIGQHFDNLWIYGKAVTDKYDADNRIDFGISKDLVAEALKNFGVKLYTSNNSIEDLFGSFIGQAYQSGSEYITNYITGSLTGSNTPIEPSSYDNYNKEVQKRIYHNLSYLLKTKGTERGVRALINCYGIPSEILQIKLFGGRNVNERPFFGDYQHYTSSLDKIRLDNTGSIIPGETLSLYTSTRKKEYKYTDDLHSIEVGFSPSDNIDAYIISHSAATFNIDDYIGDPRDLTTANYNGLYNEAESILGNLDRYNLQDFVRLIKFFDNTIFKSIKDFIPARVVADTGIIIKPNLLNRSKARSVKAAGTRPEHSGSVNTAFIESTDGGVYQTGSIQINTAYSKFVKTPEGIILKQDHSQEEAKYDGELKDSIITITNGELGKNNPYINPIYPTTYFDINIYSTPPAGLCILGVKPPGTALPNSTINLASYFTNTTLDTEFKIGPSLSNLTVVPNPSNYLINGGVGQVFHIQAEDPNATNTCIKTNTITLQVCSITFINPLPELVQPGQTITFVDYINNPAGLTNVKYYIDNIEQNGSTYTVPTTAITSGQTTFRLKVESNAGGCVIEKIFNISSVSVTVDSFSIYVTVAEAVVTVTNLNTNTTISERGICWSTSPNPTTSNFKQTTNQTPGVPFSIVPAPLTPDTTYYFRAYAITPLGTVYSTVTQEKTLKLGITTIVATVNNANLITLLVNTTNPASLPLTSTSTLAIQETNNYNSNISIRPVSNPYPNEANESNYTYSVTISANQLQPNTTYYFRGRTLFRQGNTGVSLGILSSQATAIPYTRSPITIGTLLGGGAVYNVIQRGDTGYNGITHVFVLADQNYGANGNIASAGTTVTYNQRITAGQNPPGTNALGLPGWKAASLSDFTAIWTNRSLLPSAYTNMLNNRDFYMSDSFYYYDFNTSTSATATGNKQTISSYNNGMYVRSVRTFSF
jgi:hypothetical protein